MIYNFEEKTREFKTIKTDMMQKEAVNTASFYVTKIDLISEKTVKCTCIHKKHIQNKNIHCSVIQNKI